MIMPRILVVDDNEMNRDILARRLSTRGFEVIVAEDAGQGIAKVRGESPDLVLMDMRLPDMDGWAAAKSIKADDATSKIPIIALTAHALDVEREAALEAGCDEYETKPVVMDRLLGKMNQLLNRSAPLA